MALVSLFILKPCSTNINIVNSDGLTRERERKRKTGKREKYQQFIVFKERDFVSCVGRERITTS